METLVVYDSKFGNTRKLAETIAEVPDGELAPILKAYLPIASGARPHVPVDKSAPIESFEEIAANFPSSSSHLTR